MKHAWHRLTIAVLWSAVFVVASSAVAQLNPVGSGGGGLFDSAPADAKSVVSIEAQFTAPAAGQPGRLLITAKIKSGWHIYSVTQPPGGPIATKIEVSPPPGVRITGAFLAQPAPDKKQEPLFDNLTVESHHDTVAWSAPIELAAGVDPAKLKIEGKVTVQPCDANACLPPTPIAFAATLGSGASVPLAASHGTPAGGANAPTTSFDLNALKIVENDRIRQTSMAWAILMGFVGGLILNLMPCVLPVIGLKILSFLEQSGHSRGHALLLNVWYSLGMLAVFLGLATLAVTKGFGWGQLFSDNGFSIALTAVVFAMGLSLLGVWEIPIPGFLGRGKAVELAEKEGSSGALLKGAITTVLATPCTAPFLASALTWAATPGQPPAKVYAVFAAAGLGMASPYLLIGAFPGLISFLPKPGAWMDTFKQIMGFVLLGTVVFLLTFLTGPLVVPTVAFLFGIWGACWWIGRAPAADPAVTARAWLEAAAFAAAVWIVTFGWLSGVMRSRFDRSVEEAIASRMVQSKEHGSLEVVVGPTAKAASRMSGNHLPWQPFTQKVLEDAIASGATVLVDFTADWCLTCKTLEAAVLNTRDVCRDVQANGVVTLQADWTHGQPEVTKMLELLGSKQVPVLAIFPAGNPNQPIVFRGGYTRQMLLDALTKAGPSKGR